jgi:subtilisin-like proprotein convertase family protein
MIKYILSIVFLLFIVQLSYSQHNYWKPFDYKELKNTNLEVVNDNLFIKNASYFELNLVGLKSKLDLAPYRKQSNDSNVDVIVPNQKGEFEVYEVFKVQTLAPQLSRDYPEIQSFVGRKADKSDASVLRITITPQGFYAMIRRPNVGQLFINKYDENGEYYISFLKNDARHIANFSCGLMPTDKILGKFNDKNMADLNDETVGVDDNTLRTYGLALSCTGEYAQFHINRAGLSEATPAEQVAAVLGAMTVTVDRVNSIYEIDLGINFQIVENNNQIIYLNPETDPFNNTNIFSIVDENQVVLDNEIGSSNYNIGHVFSTGGGGFAPGSVCVDGDKARAVTGLVAPIGDPFDVDYVSHEIGHQFGAGHTQNNDCGRFDLTAVEPGSASTIMGYAGICAPNIQSHSDAYFHQINIAQIYNYITEGEGASCGDFNSQTNTAPIIIPLPDSYTIPNGTAFYLDVEVVDDENDPLTYCWEQFDHEESIQPPLTASITGPNFRSRPPVAESIRYFPKFSDVLISNLKPTWEVVPTVSRSMDFVVTVRDNNNNVGQSDREFVKVNFANVGPFQVTSQNSADINWLPEETQTITWDVAGTTGNGIDTANVDILLSTDGGATFDTILVSNTLNDGIEDIVVPDIQSSACRIMVKPVDNIYYALNAEGFSIANSDVTCVSYTENSSVAIPDGLGTPQNPEEGSTATSIINIPDNFTNVSDVNIFLNVIHSNVNDLSFELQAPSGDKIILWSRNCSTEESLDITFNDAGISLPDEGSECSNPVTGIYTPFDSETDLATLFSNGTVGEWVLSFSDFYPENAGILNRWSIEICSTNFSVETNVFNDFSIVPNPNNGVFTLNFNQPLGNNTNISIYDLRGRLVEKISPEQNTVPLLIELQNQHQSGVYLLEIANEQGKSIKKLVIQ